MASGDDIGCGDPVRQPVRLPPWTGPPPAAARSSHSRPSSTSPCSRPSVSTCAQKAAERQLESHRANMLLLTREHASTPQQAYSRPCTRLALVLANAARLLTAVGGTTAPCPTPRRRWAPRRRRWRRGCGDPRWRHLGPRRRGPLGRRHGPLRRRRPRRRPQNPMRSHDARALTQNMPAWPRTPPKPTAPPESTGSASGRRSSNRRRHSGRRAPPNRPIRPPHAIGSPQALS